MRHVVVVGAGPAGLTAAYALSKAEGTKVTLLEASRTVGGMARTIELWGQRVDIGPHRFFSSDTRVNRLWLEVMGRDYDMVRRLTRIHYRNRFFYYPLRPGNALQNLGLLEAARCVSSYGLARLRRDHDTSTFEGWVVSRFGRRLYEIFFKSYTEKLWGIPCANLDADFAAQRIKKLNLLEALKNAFFGGKEIKHKTLADEFAYPHGGTGTVYERMAEAVSGAGGTVRLGTAVQGVLLEAGRVTGVQLEGGELMMADHVISTMPISLLVERMAAAPADVLEACRALRFRNTLLVYLKLEAGERPLWPDQWLYVHSPGLGVGRVTNFENWSGTLRNGCREPILALEYWCYPEDGAWREPDEALVARATKEINEAGLDGGRQVLAGHVVRVPRCYPVYASGYKQHLAVVEGWLRGIRDLQPIGRYGSFKYNNQDHSILMGLLAAENFLAGEQMHDLWAINTDYEYQEASRIDATGLVVAKQKGNS